VIYLLRTLLEKVYGIGLPIRAVAPPSLAIMLLESLVALAVAWLFYLAFERHTAALRHHSRTAWPQPRRARARGAGRLIALAVLGVLMVLLDIMAHSSPRAMRASQAA
jgi:hypothetical protein